MRAVDVFKDPRSTRLAEDAPIAWDAISQQVLPWRPPRAAEIDKVLSDVQRCSALLFELRVLKDYILTKHDPPEKATNLLKMIGDGSIHREVVSANQNARNWPVMKGPEALRLRNIWPVVDKRLEVFDSVMLLHPAVREQRNSIKARLASGEASEKEAKKRDEVLNARESRLQVELRCVPLEAQYFYKESQALLYAYSKELIKEDANMKEVIDKLEGQVRDARKQNEKHSADTRQAEDALQKDLVAMWHAAIKHVEQEVLNTQHLQALAVRRLRRAQASGLRKYASGQRLHACVGGKWRDVMVASPPVVVSSSAPAGSSAPSGAPAPISDRLKDAGRTLVKMASAARLIADRADEHTLEGPTGEGHEPPPPGSTLRDGTSTADGDDAGGGPRWQMKLNLHPFNHSPAELDGATFEALWKRHAQEMRRKHSSLVDALSGQRLDINEQIVPLEIDHQLGSDYQISKVENVRGLNKWLHDQYTSRVNGDASNASCILLKGPPAAGKTCLMSQLITLALTNDDGSVRKQPLLVPILIKILDLQKELLRDGAEEEFSKSWCATPLPFSTRPTFLVLTHTLSLLASALRNWVDAYLRIKHGEHSEYYRMLRQALMARRVLLLLDGIDEGGRARDKIEQHVAKVLAPQGFVMLVTSRPAGVRQELFEDKVGMRWEPIGHQKPESGIELYRGGMHWKARSTYSLFEDPPTGKDLMKKLGRAGDALKSELRERVERDGDDASIHLTFAELRSLLPGAVFKSIADDLQEDGAYIKIELGNEGGKEAEESSKKTKQPKSQPVDPALAELAKIESVKIEAIDKSVDRLDVRGLQMIRTGYKVPPNNLVMVMQAMCVLFNMPSSQWSGEYDWADCRKLVADPQRLLDAMRDFDRDNIPDKVISKLQPYIENEMFNPNNMQKISSEAGQLCKWILAIHKYHLEAKSDPTRQAQTGTRKRTAKKRDVFVELVNRQYSYHEQDSSHNLLPQFDALHRALRTGKVEFSLAEMQTYTHRGFTTDHYIDVDGLFFRPSEAYQHFRTMSLKPLTEEQQAIVVKGRLRLSGLESRAPELIEFIKKTVPRDAESDAPVTGNPLMLSMVVSIFETNNHSVATPAGGGVSSSGMPAKISTLYETAMQTMLKRVNRKQPSATAAANVPYLIELLQAVAFEAHSNEERSISLRHLHAAAIRISRDRADAEGAVVNASNAERNPKGESATARVCTPSLRHQKCR